MIKRTSITSPTSMYQDDYYNKAKYCGKTGYFNGRYKNGYQCVNYAVSRSCELAGKPVCYYSGISTKDQIEKPMFNRSGYGNAVTWLADTLWETGTEPKLGAIMVYGSSYGSGYGHVRVVEAINGNTITYSGANESKLMAFKNLVKPTISKTGFLGYIYNPYVDTFNVETVERDESKNQVEVLADTLKCRNGANGTYLGYFAEKGLYDIQATEINGDYAWAKLADNVWIALNDNEGWTKTYLCNEKSDYEDMYNDLKSKYDTLETDYKNLGSENVELNTQLKQAQNERDTIKQEYETISATLKKIKELVE